MGCKSEIQKPIIDILSQPNNTTNYWANSSKPYLNSTYLTAVYVYTHVLNYVLKLEWRSTTNFTTQSCH